MTNGPCERCGRRPHSWFTDAGYLCAPCADELRLWNQVVVPVMLGHAHLGRVTAPSVSGADNGDNQ